MGERGGGKKDAEEKIFASSVCMCVFCLAGFGRGRGANGRFRNVERENGGLG